MGQYKCALFWSDIFPQTYSFDPWEPWICGWNDLKFLLKTSVYLQLKGQVFTYTRNSRCIPQEIKYKFVSSSHHALGRDLVRKIQYRPIHAGGSYLYLYLNVTLCNTHLFRFYRLHMTDFLLRLLSTRFYLNDKSSNKSTNEVNMEYWYH